MIITLLALFIIGLNPVTAVNIVDVHPTDHDLLIGDTLSLNATVDGENNVIETVTYNLQTNNTTVKSGITYDYSSGDVKDISKWYTGDVITSIESNTEYEVLTVATTSTGKTDSFSYELTTYDVIEETKDPLESTDRGFITKFMSAFGLNNGIFNRTYQDLTVGEAIVIILILGAIGRYALNM